MAPLHGWTEREGDEQQRSEWVEKKKKRDEGKEQVILERLWILMAIRRPESWKDGWIFKLCIYTWNKVAINKEYKRSQGPMKSPA